MDVRPATLLDLPYLRQLFVDFAHEVPHAYPVMDDEEYDAFLISLARHMSNNPYFAVFVACDETKPIAFLGAEIVQRVCGKPRMCATAHWLYVSPAYRKAGVARAIIAKGLEWLTTFPVTYVEFFSAEGDSAWARRGFKPFLTRYMGTVGDVIRLGEQNAVAVPSNGNGAVAPVVEAAPKKRRRRVRRERASA